MTTKHKKWLVGAKNGQKTLYTEDKKSKVKLTFNTIELLISEFKKYDAYYNPISRELHLSGKVLVKDLMYIKRSIYEHNINVSNIIIGKPTRL
jgi:hypothetical protein